MRKSEDLARRDHFLTVLRNLSNRRKLKGLVVYGNRGR